MHVVQYLKINRKVYTVKNPPLTSVPQPPISFLMGDSVIHFLCILFEIIQA